MKIRIFALCVVCAVLSGMGTNFAHMFRQTQTVRALAAETTCMQQETTSEAQVSIAVPDRTEPAAETTQPVKAQSAAAKSESAKPVATQPAAAKSESKKPAATQPAAAKSESKKAAKTQPAAAKSESKKTAPADSVPTPQESDFDALEYFVQEFYLYDTGYDCETDSVFGLFAQSLDCAGALGHDPYGLIQMDVNARFCRNEYGEAPDGRQFDSPDPQHRFDGMAYFALREDILIFIKETVFNNHLPLEKEYYDYNEASGQSSCEAYYDDGWYYFCAGMGEDLSYCKYTSCTPTENGHYQIGMEARSRIDDTLEYTMTIDAQLIEKNGVRVWKISKVTPEYHLYATREKPVSALSTIYR